MSKTVVLTGGGTAGHIYPALALAEVLSERGYKVFYAGTPGGIEADIVPAAGVPFKAFEASGFDRAHPLTLVSGVARILKSAGKAKRWFKQISPDAVVGFGGYVSIPVARAAERCGIPVVVHEQNSVAGMANKYIAKKAHDVCLTYPEAAPALGAGARNTIVTGNPVRSSVVSATRADGRAYLDIPQDATMLLVFGGSRGARHINEALASMKDDLLAIPGLYVVHITGPGELAAVQKALSLTEGEAKRYRVMGYENNMAQVLAASDAIVSRAGATSLAEIAARAIPALLVPYPYARGDHQTVNAQSYATSGGAQVFADDTLDSGDFKKAVLEMAGNAGKRLAMHEAASKLDAQDAAGKLADVVESAVAGKVSHGLE